MTNNCSSSPCTPNGKIKVYMSNIASNLTKARNVSNDCKDWRKCEFDQQNCITLADVLETFNASISEEQAWAICYSFIKCIRRLRLDRVKSSVSSNTFTSTNANNFHIYLHKDGYVHEKTIFEISTSLKESDRNSNERSIEQNVNNTLTECDLMNESEYDEQELLMRLGLALFDALDYKKDSNEDLIINPELEELIAKITLEETDGSRTFTIDDIYDICCSRKANQNEEATDEFYTCICRTLVIETIELSTFLQTISEGTQIRDRMLINRQPSRQDCTDGVSAKLNNDEPLKMHLAQWAKLWMQVLEEFRNGKRKLRKVNTIVNENANLNKSNHQLSQLDRINAHALIMDYIRSRPALMPANNRELGPLKPSPRSLIEQIHDQIRRRDVKLKPVVHTNPRSALSTPVVGRVLDPTEYGHELLDDKRCQLHCGSENSSPIIRKKLIKADIDSFMDDSDFSGVKKYSSLF